MQERFADVLAIAVWFCCQRGDPRIVVDVCFPREQPQHRSLTGGKYDTAPNTIRESFEVSTVSISSAV